MEGQHVDTNEEMDIGQLNIDTSTTLETINSYIHKLELDLDEVWLNIGAVIAKQKPFLNIGRIRENTEPRKYNDSEMCNVILSIKYYNYQLMELKAKFMYLEKKKFLLHRQKSYILYHAKQKETSVGERNEEANDN